MKITLSKCSERMRLNKILALIYRDLIIFIRAKWRLADFVCFPIITILMWAFFALHAEAFAVQAGLVVLAINVFLMFASSLQSLINLQFMEDVWSASIKNVLLTAIRPFEFIFAKTISAFFPSIPVYILMLGISYHFGFTLLIEHSLFFLLITVLIIIASIALANIIGAAILMLGREYGFLSWTAINFFMFFSAPFFPIKAFPSIIRPIAWAMPYTWSFQAIRMLIETGRIIHSFVLFALLSAIAYLAASIIIYKFAFERARATGKLTQVL